MTFRSPVIPYTGVISDPEYVVGIAISGIPKETATTLPSPIEEQPPTVDEMRRRFDDVRARGLPWLAADFGGALAGYGYCAPYRARSAYRYALEDSVYVRAGSEGRGVRPRVRSACDEAVSIPLAGRIESLNVSTAAAVLLFEAVRQRRE